MILVSEIVKILHFLFNIIERLVSYIWFVHIAVVALFLFIILKVYVTYSESDNPSEKFLFYKLSPI